MNDGKLIELVRYYRVLYDPTHPKYMDTDFKSNVWKKIGEEIETTGKACKTRWGNIRDNFRKSLKKKTSVRGQKRKSGKVYKYSEQLSFLKAFLNETEAWSCIADEVINQDLSEDDKEKYNIETEEQKFHVESPTGTSGYSAPKKIKLSLQQNDPSKSTADIVMEYLIKEQEIMDSSSIQSSDPVDAFLSGIAPALKKLPPRYWHYAKTDIFAAVQKYELQMLLGEEPNSGSCAVSH